ncbi:MAG TPA: VWA domain-containing protein [Candidatus Acidoferrum sp.]|jgi:Ca-activated chloride channel family protein|nr:VWA domain-containing protein [Candidatus Acidoferrum sp.]
MRRGIALALAILMGIPRISGQEQNPPLYRANVHLVSLTFTVVDAKGNAVAGIQPDDVRVLEDGIPQKLASFAEGSIASQRAGGTSVFVLFDTSNRMYRWFPYVYDSIADFVRNLNPADAVAIYTFSRNLSRVAPLTNDHAVARAGLTNAMAGDDTAVFNALLLTLRDAERVPGRRAVVVFSNGPDNVSMVTPDDVGRVAENEGIPVYIVSTIAAEKECVMADALRRLTARTGGKLYLAGKWQHQARAFEEIRREIGSSYTAYYYPAPNPNEGFRSLEVQIVSASGKEYHVRARAGYQFGQPTHGSTN